MAPINSTSPLLLDGPTVTRLLPMREAIEDPGTGGAARPVALTSLRTPAVSAVAVALLATPDSNRLVVFGTGPQACGHVAAMRGCARSTTSMSWAGAPIRRQSWSTACAGGLSAAVANADIVCCCTTARTPVVDTDLVRPHATAMREAGDIQAVHSGRLAPESLLTLPELVRGEVTVPDARPRVYKSTGMAWQDLVTAAAVLAARRPD